MTLLEIKCAHKGNIVGEVTVSKSMDRNEVRKEYERYARD